MRPNTVWLNSSDRARAEYFASRRQSWLDQQGSVVDRRVDPNHSSAAVELLGIQGEIAAAKWFGVPDDSIRVLGADPGYDLFARGLTVDVKTTATRSRDPHLICRQPPTADVLVLVTARGNTFTLRGWITGRAFRARARRWRSGVGTAIPASGLLPMFLFQYCARADVDQFPTNFTAGIDTFNQIG